jgi:ArsR family transcriptional regulator
MLRLLGRGVDVCSCYLVADAPVSQPSISHHLRVLRESGWVTTERRGTWIWYSLREDAAERFARLAGQVGGSTATISASGSRRLSVIDLDGAAPVARG